MLESLTRSMKLLSYGVAFLLLFWVPSFAVASDDSFFVGVGFGLLFSNCKGGNDEESENDESGPVQLQTGIGLSVSVLSWLELNTETRLRLGASDNTDVMTLIQHLGIVFRF